MWGRNTGTLTHRRGGCTGLQLLLKTVWGLPGKLNTELPYDSTAGHVSKRMKSKDSNGYLYPKVHSNIIRNNQKMETIQVNWQVNKQNVV